MLTNLRFRLNYPGLGYDSGDLYGKVIAIEQHQGTPITRIRLTSIDPVDQKILEVLRVLKSARVTDGSAGPRRTARRSTGFLSAVAWIGGRRGAIALRAGASEG